MNDACAASSPSARRMTEIAWIRLSSVTATSRHAAAMSSSFSTTRCAVVHQVGQRIECPWRQLRAGARRAHSFRARVQRESPNRSRGDACAAPGASMNRDFPAFSGLSSGLSAQSTPTILLGKRVPSRVLGRSAPLEVRYACDGVRVGIPVHLRFCLRADADPHDSRSLRAACAAAGGRRRPDGRQGGVGRGGRADARRARRRPASRPHSCRHTAASTVSSIAARAPPAPPTASASPSPCRRTGTAVSCFRAAVA